MTSRGYISLKTKLAAALCTMMREENGKLVPVIPYEQAKRMTEDEILALFHWDHYPIRKAEGGADAHWNLVPRLIPEHVEKTAKVDVPEIAKGKRIAQKHEEFRRRLLAKDNGEKVKRSRWPKRSFPKRPKGGHDGRSSRTY